MTAELKTMRLSDITFDEGLYPRLEGHDPATVQDYARDIEQIEAAGKFISVNGAGQLVDGRHRMLAYRKLADGGDPEIRVYWYPVTSPLESFRLANKLQEKGRPLTTESRQASAKRMYALGDDSQKSIAEWLDVAPSTVSTWLSRTIKEEKERKKEKAHAMWLACATLEEMADACDVAVKTADNWTDEFCTSTVAEEMQNWQGFAPPIYNVWKQQTKSAGADHFGNSEPRWVENLLHLYTAAADIVVDPFAGSGSTIDVCKKRGRRYYVADRKPVVEREHEIRQHDLIGDDGSIRLPRVPRWKDVKLVYLDPPYWKQAEGQYSTDPTDLGNMSLEDFNAALAGIIKAFATKLTDAYIALIIQPTQWKAPDRQYTDHVGDMLRAVKRPVDMRYSAPYESQQCTAQMVEWAKEHKRCLVLTREIIVWRVP